LTLQVLCHLICFQHCSIFQYSEKGCFYASTIDKEEKQRKRTTKINSRREFSFKYHFKISTSKIRVCKQSSRRCFNYHYFINRIRNEFLKSIVRHPIDIPYVDRSTTNAGFRKSYLAAYQTSNPVK
jgi:hypothetical protein